MKRILTVVSALLLTLGMVGVAGSATITFDDVAPSVMVGDTLTLTIIGTDFTTGTTGGGLDLAWDPSILSLAGVIRIFPSDMFFGSDGTPGPGSLTGLSVSSFDGVAGPTFDIATISFDTIGVTPGSTIDLIVSLTDVWPDFDGINELSPTTIGATVEVTAPVPIPGSILLLGSGLVGLIGLVRRKRS